MQCFHVVLWALLLAMTDGPPTDVPKELTDIPGATIVLAVNVTDQTEKCVWLKDGDVLFDKSDTAYLIKGNDSHQYLKFYFMPEKHSGTYECQIKSGDGSYKVRGTYKLRERSQDDCITRQGNNPASNFLDVNLAEIVIIFLSAITAYKMCFPDLWKLCRRCHALVKGDSNQESDSTVEGEQAKLCKPAPRELPIQVSE